MRGGRELGRCLRGLRIVRTVFPDLDDGRSWGTTFHASDDRQQTYNGGSAMSLMAGATTVADLANAIAIRSQESAVIAELKAGSEDAYSWLIGEFHQPIYSLVYRMVNDPADAADTTQEVFLKVFRGMKHFHGQSSLKTWIYRIAVHEASNRRRWWFRHKSREASFDLEGMEAGGTNADVLLDDAESPFDQVAHEEVRAHVEQALAKVPEPYRTTLILRDLEEMSYDDIAEVTEVSLGTVKSRVTRGRDHLRKRLTEYVKEIGPQLGLETPGESVPRGRAHHSKGVAVGVVHEVR
jgi:RNA polymerase sigma-70 factor, ECF subfamily